MFTISWSEYHILLLMSFALAVITLCILVVSHFFFLANKKTLAIKPQHPIFDQQNNEHKGKPYYKSQWKRIFNNVSFPYTRHGFSCSRRLVGIMISRSPISE